MTHAEQAEMPDWHVDYGAPHYITARMNPDKDCIYCKLNQIETIIVVAVEAAFLWEQINEEIIGSHWLGECIFFLSNSGKNIQKALGKTFLWNGQGNVFITYDNSSLLS